METIKLAHGSGGKLSEELIEQIIRPILTNPLLEQGHDGAVFSLSSQKLAFTNDGFVVSPLFFPGGDIGTLAVNGTVNDLAMCGAMAKHLSLVMILEEGLPLSSLKRILNSITAAAKEAGVAIVTGDTKVVEAGKGDGIYLTTAGIGEVYHDISPKNLKVGQQILISGGIAEHGLTILCAREELELASEQGLQSDCAPLNNLTHSLLSAAPSVSLLRDPTRGGVAATCNEIAKSTGHCLVLEEKQIPIRPDVASGCEILGIDPLQMANEGKLIAFVNPEETDQALEAMRRHPLGKNACLIGKVHSSPMGQVLINTTAGGKRRLEMPLAEQLPRIC